MCSKCNNVLLWIDERKKAISLRPSLGRVGQESEKLDQFRMIDASHVASDQTSRGQDICAPKCALAHIWRKIKVSAKTS